MNWTRDWVYEVLKPFIRHLKNRLGNISLTENSNLDLIFTSPENVQSIVRSSKDEFTNKMYSRMSVGNHTFKDDVLTTTSRIIVIPLSTGGKHLNISTFSLTVTAWKVVYILLTDEEILELRTGSGDTTLPADRVLVENYASVDVDNKNMFIIGYNNGDREEFIFSNGLTSYVHRENIAFEIDDLPHNHYLGYTKTETATDIIEVTHKGTSVYSVGNGTWNNIVNFTKPLHGNFQLDFEFFWTDVNYAHMMFGLSKNPNVALYSDLDYALYKRVDEDSAIVMYEDGTSIAPLKNIAAKDATHLAIVKSGCYIKYYINNYLIREAVIPPAEINQPYYLAGLIHEKTGARNIQVTQLPISTPNKEFKYVYSGNVTFGTTATKLITTGVYTIQPNKNVELSISFPIRCDSTSWGGAYVQTNININGTWYNFGNCGYDGNSMYYSAKSISCWKDVKLYDIIKLLGLDTNVSYTVQFEFLFKGYNATSRLNGSHDLNRTADGLNNRGALVTEGSDQNYSTVYVREKDR